MANPRITTARILQSAVLGIVCIASEFFFTAILSADSPIAQSQTIDVAISAMDTIPPGSLIDDAPPKGWTHLVFTIKPRLAEGDIDQLPGFAANFASMFPLVCLANARRRENGDWTLDKTAVGFVYPIKGKTTVISSSSQKSLRANLGFMERMVLSENEKCLKKDEVHQVIKSSNMLVFDANCVMHRDGRHQDMVLRRAIVVSQKTGGLGSLVWLLDPKEKGAARIVEKHAQFFPANVIEDRKMRVDGSQIRLGLLPGPRAFAMLRTPKGSPLEFTAELREVAAHEQFTVDSAAHLEDAVWKLLAKAGVK